MLSLPSLAEQAPIEAVQFNLEGRFRYSLRYRAVGHATSDPGWSSGTEPSPLLRTFPAIAHLVCKLI